MEANINTQDVGAKKPSLLGMITSPGEQFERMKTKSPVWGICLICYIRNDYSNSSVLLNIN